MPKNKVTLLDRAKGDLKVAKNTLKGIERSITDDVEIDIIAYLCQQCVEKVAKYVILLEGKKYVTDHRSEEYLEDLEDEEIKMLVESVASHVDKWATTIRYASSIKSSKKSVNEVIPICEKLIELAELKTPKQVDDNLNCTIKSNIVI